MRHVPALVTVTVELSAPLSAQALAVESDET